MTLSLVSVFLWVLAATIVAFLPMRRQILPGLVLLALVPLLLIWLATEHSPWLVGAALLAFMSMFRNPLRYLMKRALGRAGPGQVAKRDADPGTEGDGP